MKMKWIALAATMVLGLGCAPDLHTGAGGSGTGGATSSNGCVLGQSKVGNCVLGP